MRELTQGVMFCGGGGSTEGAKQAGYKNSWGLDFWPRAIEVYKANHGDGSVVDITKCDPENFAKVNLLMASPSCKNLSRINHLNSECQKDIDAASAVARFIDVGKPGAVVVENVKDYKDSQSIKVIWNTLNNAGYQIDIKIYNACSLGLPQKRERLIIRAVKPDLATLVDVQLAINQPTWPELLQDLYQDLKVSPLTSTQKIGIRKKLFNEKTEKWLTGEYLVMRIGHRDGKPQIVDALSPSPTIIASWTNDNQITGKQKRLFKKYLSKEIGIVDEGELEIIAEKEIKGGNWPIHLDRGSPRNNFMDWVTIGQDGPEASRNISIECLKRLQGFPSNYIWDGDIRWDGEIVGNAVPPPMMKRIVESIKWK